VALTPPKAAVPPEVPEQPKGKILGFVSGKKGTIALAVVACLAVGLAVRTIAANNSDAAAKKPTYQTVLPKSKSISQLGGWKRISPPGKDPVFAFADTIDGIPVSVSQQPLPASFKGDAVNQTAEVAKKFNATDKIEAGGIDVYVGTSIKGPQSVIFTKDNLLVFIKSEKKIKDTSWAAYAHSLN
jgi:uncharacterized protein YbaA (DUF1428 family)